MSTKKKTQTTATFNPTGMQSYQSLQNPIQQGLQQNMSDPFTAMAYNQQLAQSNSNVFNQDYSSNVAGNMSGRGINPNSPLYQRAIQNAGMATRGQQNAGMNNLLLQAGQLSQGSAIAATQYQPLQTGTTSTNQNTGLGSYV